MGKDWEREKSEKYVLNILKDKKHLSILYQIISNHVHPKKSRAKVFTPRLRKSGIFLLVPLRMLSILCSISCLSVVQRYIPPAKIIEELMLPKFVLLPSLAPTDPLPQPALVGEGIIHYEGGVEMDDILFYLPLLYCAGAVVAVDKLAEFAGNVVGTDRLRGVDAA